MDILKNVLTIVALVVAVLFTLIVLVTGKGDAMSGGGSGVRTSFKGKASFEDKMTMITVYMGVGFVVLMVILAFIGSRTA